MKWHPSGITRTWIPRETAPATKSEEKRMFSQATRIGEVKTSIDNTTGQRSLFLDSSIFFFNSTRIFFDSNFKISTRVFFFRSWTYILQISTHIFYCIRRILQVSTYILCFQHIFTIGIILSATERHNKACCTCEVVVLPILSHWFFPFSLRSPSLLLKLPN